MRPKLIRSNAHGTTRARDTSIKARVEPLLNFLRLAGAVAGGAWAYTSWLDPEIQHTNQPVNVELSSDWKGTAHDGFCLVRMSIRVANSGTRTSYLLGYTASVQQLPGWVERPYLTGTASAPAYKVDAWNDERVQDLQSTQPQLLSRENDRALLVPGEKYDVTRYAWIPRDQTEGFYQLEGNALTEVEDTSTWCAVGRWLGHEPRSCARPSEVLCLLRNGEIGVTHDSISPGAGNPACASIQARTTRRRTMYHQSALLDTRTCDVF